MVILCTLYFRYQQCFYGVNLSSLRGAAVDEYFRQPIVVSMHSLQAFSPSVYLLIHSLRHLGGPVLLGSVLSHHRREERAPWSSMFSSLSALISQSIKKILKE